VLVFLEDSYVLFCGGVRSRSADLGHAPYRVLSLSESREKAENRRAECMSLYLEMIVESREQEASH